MMLVGITRWPVNFHLPSATTQPAKPGLASENSRPREVAAPDAYRGGGAKGAGVV